MLSHGIYGKIFESKYSDGNTKTDTECQCQGESYRLVYRGVENNYNNNFASEHKMLSHLNILFCVIFIHIFDLNNFKLTHVLFCEPVLTFHIPAQDFSCKMKSSFTFDEK